MGIIENQEQQVTKTDFKDIVSYALVFQQQIRRTQEEAGGLQWNWESNLPGPISIEDAEMIMGIAGCWCRDPSEKSVWFYTNQNHPIWIKSRYWEL